MLSFEVNKDVYLCGHRSGCLPEIRRSKNLWCLVPRPRERL